MRLNRRLLWILGPVTLICLGVGGLALPADSIAEAQGPAPAQARITSPASNTTVSGVVQIQGVATATNFVRYEIALLQESNPSAGYQGLGSSNSPVTNGLLATWDTAANRANGVRQYPDGKYSIRLRVVYSVNGTQTTLENVQSGIVVANQPGGLGATGAITSAGTISSTGEISGTARSGFQIPNLNLGATFDAMRQSFCSGVYLAFLAFAALAVFVIVRWVLGWLMRVIFPDDRRR